VAEGASNKATRKYEALATELREAQAQHVNEKAGLEKKLRDLQEQNQSLREDTEDAQAQLTDQARQHLHQINDVEAKRVALQDTADRLRYDMQRVGQDLENTQTRLSKRDAEVENLEAEVVQLKSRAGDGDSLAVVQRELSDQISHIRKLESTNREQLAELRRLRNAHQSVQVVEEQKRSLETELQVLQDVHRQLGEAQIQKELLEDEKRTWSTLLDRDGKDAEFDSPEAVVKAFVLERIERASLVDRVGKLEAELTEKDENIKALEGEKLSLKQTYKEQEVIAQTGAIDTHDNKAYKRLDRQRVLAVKEVEYLRAQLKTFDTEETVLMSNDNFDTQRVEQIKQLESLVDQYRVEIQSLHAELFKRDSQPPSQQSEPRGTKRTLSEFASSEDNQVGPLLRKTKNLQSALSEAATKTSILETELQATKSQLKSITSRTRTRILELRSNPTSNHEAIKTSTLTTLRTENAALLAQLRGSHNDHDLSNPPALVPAATVDNLTQQLSCLQADVATAQKQTRRLREIFGSKATEFREAVASILGYKINFLPNGKARITSTYCVRPRRLANPTTNNADASAAATQEDDEDEDAAAEQAENDNSIIFDGEEGTMKFSGGQESPFAVEMKELVRFWVQERRSVPCFLAAVTLELFERSVRVESGEEGEGGGEGEGGIAA
jgi:mitotic spindle assembly checkpoint protein MAD1